VVFASRCRPRRGSRCRRSVMTRIIVLQCVVQHRCGRVQAKFTSTRRWALVLRPEHHPRSDQSGHVEQPACRTRCPKEPHAQRSSWHLQRHRQPAQSEDLPPEVWLPTLSDDERLLYAARSRVLHDVSVVFRLYNEHPASFFGDWLH
jgi:hypothetical protein